ncbi:MAG TPA: type II secretion system F family protein [Ilumatobacter sp.]|jgi:tight adherence protein C|nr:type II secretion system F family protein [Ilumatobacter sp.]
MRTAGLLALLSLLCVGGLCCAVTGWMQPAPSLTRTLRHLRRPGSPAVPSDDRPNRNGPAVRWAASGLRRHPRLLPTDTQLRLVGRSSEQHVARLFAAVVAGVLAPGLVVAVLQWAGIIGPTWFVPVVAAVLCGAVGAMVVHLTTVERAAAVRTDLRYQLSAYLDVVTMLLAGNSGYEGALEQASRAGDGRLFAEVRRRMRESGARGASLTDALHQTGVELGLDELEQVAATAALSAAEGAPVARTLAAKCATLRMALATEQESEARLRTSRLTTPIVGMALIFMALVIYPALSFA